MINKEYDIIYLWWLLDNTEDEKQKEEIKKQLNKIFTEMAAVHYE